MKNTAWVGVTIALIASIAGAADTQPGDKNVSKPVNGSEFQNSKFLVVITSDGAAVMTRKDGTSFVLPKTLVDVILRIDTSKEFDFADGKPCATTGVRIDPVQNLKKP